MDLKNLLYNTISDKYDEAVDGGFTAPGIDTLVDALYDKLQEDDCRIGCTEIVKEREHVCDSIKEVINPKLLHLLYLEAVQYINKGNYNQKAAIEYEELTDEQKFIDIYISGALKIKINDFFCNILGG